jgi:hypothetical protein
MLPAAVMQQDVLASYLSDAFPEVKIDMYGTRRYFRGYLFVRFMRFLTYTSIIERRYNTPTVSWCSVLPWLWNNEWNYATYEAAIKKNSHGTAVARYSRSSQT